MPEAVVVATARTPIGRAKKGSLVDVRIDDLGGFIVRTLLDKVPQVDPGSIDDLIIGAANHAGEQGLNVARNVAALAGLPDTVPGTSVNRFCASSLQSIRMAFHAIKAGEGDTGGLHQQHVHPHGHDRGERGGEVRREPRAHGRVRQAEPGPGRGGPEERLLRPRDHPGDQARRHRGVEGRRSPAGHQPGGTGRPQAGLQARREGHRRNACPLNDGAAAVLVMSEERARELGLTPLARVLASSVSALAPEIMGVGPVDAIRKVLALAGMSISDIGVVELNEAFAAQVLPVCDEVGISVEDQLNPHGGAIALGHPFGMTGARIMTTLLNDLQTLDRTLGLETMCVGGGQGMAMIVERLS